MSSETWTASSSWLLELLEDYAAEIQDRNLVLLRELDPNFQMTREPLLEAALRELFRFVFATLPNGCDFYLASARRIAAVTRLNSGTLTLRWQVLGDHRTPGEGGATPLRPVTGGASFHMRSAKAKALEEAFRGAGWTMTFDASARDAELWVHAATK